VRTGEHFLGSRQGLVVMIVEVPVAWLTARPTKPRAAMVRVANFMFCCAEVNGELSDRKGLCVLPEVDAIGQGRRLCGE
jgi:hypothetical protein